jgi:periplasmic protein CpxP/Spy
MRIRQGQGFFRFAAAVTLMVSGVSLVAPTTGVAKAAETAQGPGGFGPGDGGPEGMGPMGGHRPPMEGAFRMGPMGRWWNNPEVAKKVGLSPEQQKKMDDIFQQHRLKLIDQHAAVQKEEAILQPLIEADQPDEGKVLAQIDRVAQARAELEKSVARMLLGLRRELTPEQWKTFHEIAQQRRRGEGGHGGPGREGPGRGGPGGGGPNGPADNAPGGPGEL